MRWRVILAAMAAFAAVITLIAVLVNVVNYGMVTNRADQTLEAILRFEVHTPNEPGKPGPPDRPFMGLPDVEANYMTRFFVVHFDHDDNVTFVSTDYIASIDKDTAISYAGQILEKGRTHGYMKEYRYIVDETDDGTVIVFLNILREQQSIMSLLILTIAVSVLSLIIVSILAALLSGRAIRPIANNIRLQKQFITDASHELKTPLTSISTSIDVLTMEHGDDEWTDNIRRQTERMTKLVNELVTLSRLDEESPLPDKEHFLLSNAAWEIAEVYKPQAKASGKNMETDIADDISIYGDRSSIQQMLSVLLDNALRYSDNEGDIRFSVYKKKNKVCIDVFNTCSYDTPPDTDRLFDRFYRPDSSRSTATGGTGVGLSIARAVAEAHGGTISAECPSGKTMTIKVRL